MQQSSAMEVFTSTEKFRAAFMAGLKHLPYDIDQSMSPIKVGPWNVIVSSSRAGRPAREASQPSNEIYKPYNPDAFNFNKVHEKPLWEGQIAGTDVAVLCNRYPAAPLHSLIVPDRPQNLPQFLTQPLHQVGWELMQILPPEAVIGYNSLGAFASVNHFHFQLIMELDLPVQSPALRDSYPAYYRRFASSSEAWAYIGQLHQANQPYNLIYNSGEVLVFPRKFQGTYLQPSWTSGFALFEMSGNFTVTDPGQIPTAQAIYDALAKVPSSCRIV